MLLRSARTTTTKDWSVAPRCDDAPKSIDIPSGRPHRRFIRYVRPPLKDSDTEPLYPLRPSTRPLRLGIDVATIPESPEGGFN